MLQTTLFELKRHTRLAASRPKRLLSRITSPLQALASTRPEKLQICKHPLLRVEKPRALELKTHFEGRGIAKDFMSGDRAANRLLHRLRNLCLLSIGAPAETYSVLLCASDYRKDRLPFKMCRKLRTCEPPDLLRRHSILKERSSEICSAGI